MPGFSFIANVQILKSGQSRVAFPTWWSGGFPASISIRSKMPIIPSYKVSCTGTVCAKGFQREHKRIASESSALTQYCAFLHWICAFYGALEQWKLPSLELEWRFANPRAERPHSSVTLQYHMYCCESTSWLLAALNYRYVWLMGFWKDRKRIIHRVKSFPGDLNQCVMALWNGDLPCCCVANSSFFWHCDAENEYHRECFAADLAQNRRRIWLVGMCYTLLLEQTLFTYELWLVSEIFQRPL